MFSSTKKKKNENTLVVFIPFSSSPSVEDSLCDISFFSLSEWTPSLVSLIATGLYLSLLVNNYCGQCAKKGHYFARQFSSTDNLTTTALSNTWRFPWIYGTCKKENGFPSSNFRELKYLKKWYPCLPISNRASTEDFCLL